MATGDVGKLEKRIAALETAVKVFDFNVGDIAAFSAGSCTNGCTGGCTHTCTGGCTGGCVQREFDLGSFAAG